MAKAKRVLIVDDAVDLGRLLRNTLQTEHPGIDVALVMSAEEALLEASRGKLDLLITDVRLPGMTGFDLVGKIRPRQPQMKMMVISGLTVDDALRAQIEASQVDAFMHKPLEMADFIEQANRLLGYAPSTPVHNTPSLITTTIKGDTPVDRLDALHRATGAMAVILMDGTGRIIAQSGDVPHPELIPLLVMPAIAASSAADRVAGALGHTRTRAVQVYRGGVLDLAFAPIDLATLIVLLPAGPSVLRLALVIEEVLAAQDALSKMVAAQPAPSAVTASPEVQAEQPQQKTPVNPPVMPQIPELDLDEFTAALSNSAPSNSAQDLDAFWDSATDSQTTPSNSDHLNFEQARKMGLVSDENEK